MAKNFLESFSQEKVFKSRTLAYFLRRKANIFLSKQKIKNSFQARLRIFLGKSFSISLSSKKIEIFYLEIFLKLFSFPGLEVEFKNFRKRKGKKIHWEKLWWYHFFLLEVGRPKMEVFTKRFPRSFLSPFLKKHNSLRESEWLSGTEWIFVH